MSLPPQDVLEVINDLISEITGFQENEENFTICQRYCLSHVVHHTYPFVNRTTVKNLINSYISRFYGHGYFRVSQELQHQVKSFLSNTSLFDKNPQYDIQWCLISLLSSLSSNLTDVKHVPELLPIDIEDVENEDINWYEYLKNDLPMPQFSATDESYTESVEDDEYDDNEYISDAEVDNKNGRKGKREDGIAPSPSETGINTTGQIVCQIESCADLPGKIELKNRDSVLERKNQIQRIITDRLSAIDIGNDYRKWGNISEKFDTLLYREGFSKKSQFISELEMLEYILYQFQTGERILLKKGLTHPALLSVTQKTLGNYIDSLQPYFQIIRSLKDFESDVKRAKYPELHRTPSSNESLVNVKSYFVSSPIKKKNISNVLYLYSVLLKKALDPFQNRIMDIIDNLDDYSLIRMQRDIQAHFFELSSLFYVHGLATKDWKKDCNWVCSIRVLAVLYNAIMQASTTKMSFLYLNMFLHCFGVYLDIIDSWISFLKLNDPTEDFIVVAPNVTSQSDSFCSTLEVRPYKSELKTFGVKEAPVLDLISEKMSQVWESLEVLRRMGRFVSEDTVPKISSYDSLIDLVNSKMEALKKVEPPLQAQKVQEKKRSIFTMSNSVMGLSRDNGMGDCSAVGALLEVLKQEKESKEEGRVGEETRPCSDHCVESVYSSVQNPFFKRAFEKVGVQYQTRRLNDVKAQKTGGDDGGLNLDLIRIPCEQRCGVYPYHKIILDCCREVIDSRISFACDLVKSIVMKEARLKCHISLLRSLLLFNDSYLIEPFFVEFFTQPIVWDSSYSLTYHIRECMENRYPDLVSSLSVVSETSAAMPKNILEAIDALTISYEVKWPLTLIFTPDVMTMYNKVFHLALKLKWAHWILTNLHFQVEKENTPTLLRSTHHRLQLLRFWFLSLLGILNNYFMAQLSLPDPDFEAYGSLREIIEGHSNFVSGICRRCLLSDRAPEMWSLIFESLIPICVDLEKYWREGKVVANAKLTLMETIFADCQHRLSRVMSSLEKADGELTGFK